MSVKFEGYERRIAQIEKALKEYGLESLEAARDLCLSKGVNVEEIVRGVQPIAFENAVWAYTLGAAIALKKNSKNAAEAAENIGIGLHRYPVPLQRPDFFQITPQKIQSQIRLSYTLVEQKDSEIEIVHPAFQFIKIDIGHRFLFGGLCSGYTLVGNRLAPVPNRLVQFQRHFILVFSQSRNFQTLLSQHTGQFLREVRRIGLPSSLSGKSKLRYPCPRSIREVILFGLVNQIVLTNFWIIFPGKSPAFVERKLSIPDNYREQPYTQNNNSLHNSLFFYTTHNHFNILSLTQFKKAIPIGSDISQYRLYNRISNKRKNIERNNIQQ